MQTLLLRCPPWALFLSAALAGALYVLAFAPLSCWPLQLVLLSFLFCLLQHTKTVRQLMLTTWLFGFSWIFFGVIWLTVTMFRYGDMPVWLSVLAVALFAAALACIPALMMGCAAVFRARVNATLMAMIVFPLFWSLAEWTRDWLFTGFPWLVSGYAHNHGPLAGYAPVMGVFGITWLSAVFAGSLLLVALGKRRYALGAGAILVAGLLLGQVHWTTASGAPLRVRLLQGNIDQQIKFQEQHLHDSLDFYYRAILQQPADLIVTPESALPLPQQALPPGYLDELQRFSTQTHSAIALGLFSNDAPDVYANSMLGISPAASRPVYRYDKHHLVPFGEFIPLGFGWFYQFMHIPMGDLQRGPLLAGAFAVRDQQLLPTICYEDVFGEEIAANLAHAYLTHQPVPSILLNMTNLSWFGDSWAMPQHVQITQMRTLEMGRPMLRSTNNGITALVDAQGRIVDQLPVFVSGTLAVTVQGYEGITPYVICGNYLWLGLLLLSAVLAYWLQARSLRASTLSRPE